MGEEYTIKFAKPLVSELDRLLRQTVQLVENNGGDCSSFAAYSLARKL
jgi:hypothetical protein